MNTALKWVIGILIVYAVIRISYDVYWGQYGAERVSYKVALCVSGQLRTFRQCYPGIKKYIIDCYDTDVYLCIGDEEKKEDVQEAVKLFSPKNWKQIKVDCGKLCSCKNGKDRRHLFYIGEKMKVCEEMREQSGVRYDVVIKIRPDLRLHQSVPINVMESCTVNNILWSPTVSPSTLIVYPNSFFNQLMIWYLPNSVNDQFMVASPEVMKDVTLAFCSESKKDWPCRVNYPFLFDNVVNTEGVLDKILTQRGIHSGRFPFSFYIQRTENGTIVAEVGNCIWHHAKKSIFTNLFK
jgi:hypothetical protein